MKQLKIGTLLIILGNSLYLVYAFLPVNEGSNFSDFTQGLLLGLSIGINLIGIILTAYYISKNNEKNK